LSSRVEAKRPKEAGTRARILKVIALDRCFGKLENRKRNVVGPKS